MNSIYIGTLLFIAGCFAGLKILSGSGLALYFFIGAAMAAALGIGVRRFARLLPAAIGLFFLLLGLGAGSVAPPPPVQMLSSAYGHAVSFTGRIDPLSVRHTESGSSFIVQVEQLAVQGRQLAYKGKLRVAARSKNLPDSGFVAGQGVLNELTSFRNPGSFDGDTWNHINGIGGRVVKAQVQVIDSTPALLDRLGLINIALREKIIAVLGNERGGLLAGMVLGGSAGLDDEVRDIFAANGLSHLLSVSGTHMVLLAGLLGVLLRPLPRKFRVGLIIAFLALYAALCGLRPPVLRALIMSSVLLGGSLLTSKGGAERGNILCLTAVAMLLVKPLWLLDIGFQLSFGAAAGLVWLLPYAERRLSGLLPDFLAEMAAVTIAAQLAILPLLIGYFYTLPFISIVSNIILVPVLELSAALTLLGVMVSYVTPLGNYILRLAGFFTEQILQQADFLASLPYANVVIGSLPLWCAVVYYFWLAAALDLPCVQFFSGGERKAVVAALGAVLLFCCGWKQYAPQPLTAYFLDVGQGDASVVVTPDRSVIVIDTGGLKNYDTGSKIVAPFLYSLGKSKIDLLILSHGDHDHAGGAAGLARKIKIDKVILPYEKYSEAERRLLTQIERDKVITAQTGQRFSFSEVQLEIIAAPSVSAGLASGNDASIVCAITNGRPRLLYTGDMDDVKEGMLHDLVPYDLLKVGHHGSRYSSSGYFLQQVQPRLAVISSGMGNGYGHPHEEALERLSAVGSTVLRTDQLGAVKVTFDDAAARWYSYVYNGHSF